MRPKKTRRQLDEILTALSVSPSAEQIRRLDEASAVPLDAPYGMLALSVYRDRIASGSVRARDEALITGDPGIVACSASTIFLDCELAHKAEIPASINYSASAINARGRKEDIRRCNGYRVFRSNPDRKGAIAMTRSKRVERGWRKLCQRGAIGIVSMALSFGPAWAGGNATTTGGDYVGFEDGDLSLDSIGKLKPVSREEALPAALHDPINKSKPQHGPAGATSGSGGGGDTGSFEDGDLRLDSIKQQQEIREESQQNADCIIT